MTASFFPECFSVFDSRNERLIERFLSIDCSQISDLLKKSAIFTNSFILTENMSFTGIALIRTVALRQTQLQTKSLFEISKSCYNIT
jgi:hypothetical protein